MLASERLEDAVPERVETNPADGAVGEVEQLREVICAFLRLASPAPIGKTVLVKLVYFAELESWSTRGSALTGTDFFRYHYGAWAPAIPYVAEHLPERVHHRRAFAFYPTHEYTLAQPDAHCEVSDEAWAIVRRVFARYGHMTAARIGTLSKETPPMQVALGEMEPLDFTLVAPRRSARPVVRNARLAEAASRLDLTTRGDRADINDRDVLALNEWAESRRRANALR